MTDEGNTSAQVETPASETAPMSQDQARSYFEGLLSRHSETNTAEEARDEAENAETEGDEPEAEAAEQSDDTTDAEPVVTPRKVKLPDGDEVHEDELVRGYLRQSDYTRKAQELANNRKDFETREQRIAQTEQNLAQQLEYAIAIARENIPEPPSVELRNNDPLTYIERKDEYERAVAKLQALTGARQEQISRQRAEHQERLQKRIVQEQERLFEAMPELRDDNKRLAFTAELKKAGERFGITAQEIEAIQDHRFVRVLAAAAKMAKLEAEKPKANAKIEQAAPVVRPGKRPSPQQQNAQRYAEDMARLRKTGRPDDAVSIFRNIISKG